MRSGKVSAERQLCGGVVASLEEVIPNGPVLRLIKELDEDGEGNADASCDFLRGHLSGLLQVVVKKCVVRDSRLSALRNAVVGLTLNKSCCEGNQAKDCGNKQGEDLGHCFFLCCFFKMMDWDKLFFFFFFYIF